MSRTVRVLAFGLPGLLLVGLVALGAQENDRGRITVCRHKGADGAGARKVDLGAPEHEYAAQVRATRGRLASLKDRVLATQEAGHDAGIPGCSRNSEETIELDQPLPGVFRGRPLYFVRLQRGKGGEPPGGLPRPPEKNALVFLLAYSSLADAGAFVKATGTNASIATADLARQFHVRCAHSRVLVSPDGKTLRIEEILP